MCITVKCESIEFLEAHRKGLQIARWTSSWLHAWSTVFNEHYHKRRHSRTGLVFDSGYRHRASKRNRGEHFDSRVGNGFSEPVIFLGSTNPQQIGHHQNKDFVHQKAGKMLTEAMTAPEAATGD